MSKVEKCLVAREVPTTKASLLNDDDQAAILTLNIEKLSIDEKPTIKKDAGSKSTMTPADFLTLQSIRSSALAKKTNTTLKFGKGSATLMNDLLNLPDEEKKNIDIAKKDEEKEEKKVEQKEKEEKPEEKSEKKEEEEEEEEDAELISRGPVRAARQSAVHHPYNIHATKFSSGYGSTPATEIGDYSSYSAYGLGYECGATVWQNPQMDSPDARGYISSSSTPDTIQSSSAESGYSSSSPMTYSSPSSSPQDSAYQAQSNAQRILDESTGDMPDNVSEFILAYSSMLETESKENLIYCRPPSTDSSCIDSPMSAGSAPHFSPGQPQPGNTGRISPASVIPISTDRPARQRLRVHIGQENTENAMLWMCRCVQSFNQARNPNLTDKKEGSDTLLFWQDKDKDTFLSICLFNLDVAKAYAIIEQQLKQDRKHGEYPPWDMRNRFDESPLFIAVQNRQTLFVDYLLELNADPNVQSNRNQRETALMHAAARGMNDIVKNLLRDPRTKSELENEDRMTALHLAVWNNNAFDEATQTHVDNLEVVRTLIEAGADCTKVDKLNRNVYHMAVQKCDHAMLEQLARCIPDGVALDLANRVDNDGLKPINLLEKYTGKIDHQLYQSCFFALLTCNANVERSSPTPGEQAK